MGDVVDLLARKPPVCYEMFVSHHWDGTIEVWVKGIDPDQRSRPAIAEALRAYADHLMETPDGPATA